MLQLRGEGRSIVRPILIFAMALLLATKVEASMPIPVIELTKDDIRATKLHEREARDFCRLARKAKPNFAEFLSSGKYSAERITDYADRLQAGERGCTKDLDLAVTLMENLLVGQPLISANPQWLGQLLGLLQMRGGAVDLARAEEISRYLSVRGEGSRLGSFEPKWTDAERSEFFLRDDVWAMINALPHGFHYSGQDVRMEILLDPKSIRFDPVRALSELESSAYHGHLSRAARILSEGKLVPVDLARAEALLWRAASADSEGLPPLLDLLEPHLTSDGPTARREAITRLRTIILTKRPSDEALRSRLVMLFLPDLQVSDPDTQTATATVLTQLAVARTPSAAAPLIDWISAIMRVRSEPRQPQAEAMLAQLLAGDVPVARAFLDQQIARSGGLIDAGDWTPDSARPMQFSRYINANDYPTRAMRDEREGVVEVSAIFGPGGRVVYIEIDGNPDASLAGAVSATLTRRLRRSFAEWPGHYVKVKLPPIQFRIPDCKGNFRTAPLAGTVLVDAVPRCETVQYQVIY